MAALEAALLQCLREFPLKQSGDVPTLRLAAMNEHFFRLHLEWSSRASSSGAPGGGQATDCSRGNGTPLVELDVSVPPGFGGPSWQAGHESFLATLPGTATHGPAVADQHAGSKSPSRIPHPSLPGPARTHPFSESDWEQVQEAIQQLNEKLDRIDASPAEASSSSRPPVDCFKSLEAVLDAVGRFGEKVMRLCSKGSKGGKGKGKAVEEVDGRLVDSDDDSDAGMEDDSAPGLEEDSYGVGGDDDDDEIQCTGEVKPLEAQAREANAICRDACKLCKESGDVVAINFGSSNSLAGLLRWCSVAPWRRSCCVVLAFDVHGLGAGKLEAIDSFGITQPLLLVLLRFSKLDWASWASHAGTTRGTAPQPLPKPGSVQAFQAASVEEAEERLHKYFNFNALDSGFRSELPLEWWGTQLEEKSPAAKQPEPASTSKRKLSQRESDDGGDSELSWEDWLEHVAAGKPGATQSASKCRPEDLDAHLQRIQLVVQDQVKDRQKRALQRVIPQMIESFCQGPVASAPEPKKGKGKGKGKDKGKGKVEVTPQQEQHEQLQIQRMEGDEYAGRALGNAFLPLCVFLAQELQGLHKKCPSCGELLPVATSRLRTCANPLCLYNSEELGPNISVLSELKVGGGGPEIADFQLDLADAAAGETQRDVFEPFPSFLLKKSDSARGRAGWFESQDAGGSSEGAPPVPPAWPPPVRGAAPSAQIQQSLTNKKMDVAKDLLKEMPSMTALAAASTTEASLKLQLGAVWLRFLVASQKLPGAEDTSKGTGKAPARGQDATKKGGGTQQQANGDLEGRPFQLYDFLRFALFTCRLTFMPLLGSAFELPLTGCQYQFLVLRDSPERQAYYEQRRAQFKGTPFFAFHGSAGINWFSILRNGLRSMSNTHYMSTGTAYGSGLYLSSHGGTSIGYALASVGRAHGRLSKGFRCLALCEVLAHPDKGNMDKGNTIIVVPEADVPNVFLRYLLVVEGSGTAASTWVITRGTKLQQASGETLDLEKHVQDCVQAHAAQQQQEVEQTWRSRAGLISLTLPPVSSADGRGTHELASASGNSDADYDLVYEEEEEEEEEVDEDDEVFEYLDEVKMDCRSSVERKPSPNNLASDGPLAAAADSTQAEPSAPAQLPPTSNVPRASPSVTPSQAPSSSRAPASTASAPRGGASSSAPGARSAPGAKGGSARSQSAAKAVQQEFRKLVKLQETGNSSLPKDGFQVALADETDFFRWEIQLRPTIFKDSTLKPDLEKAAAQQKVPEVPVRLEFTFPDDFPFQPPFVRVVAPRFAFHTGHITVGGSICMELLTASGWSPAYTMEAVIVQIIAEMCEGGARLDPNYMGRSGKSGEYSMQEAKDAFTRVAAQHGWRT